MATNAQLIYHLPLKLTWKETPHSRTSPSGSRKDQPPCSKKPSGSSTMVFIILVQLRDCTPSVYFRSQELRKITLWSKKINPPYSAFEFVFFYFFWFWPCQKSKKNRVLTTGPPGKPHLCTLWEHPVSRWSLASRKSRYPFHMWEQVLFALSHQNIPQNSWYLVSQSTSPHDRTPFFKKTT